MCKCVSEVGGDVAVDDEEAGAEEVVEALAEVVEEEVAQAAFGVALVFAAHETGDGLGFGVDELAQNMDAEEAGGAGEEDVFELRIEISGRARNEGELRVGEGVLLEEGVDIGVVEVGDFGVGVLG